MGQLYHTPVFNIEVEEEHEYIANGFVVHNCNGCEAQAMRGWVAIGELPEIGSQECRMGCHCGKRHRYSADAELPPRKGAKGGGDEFVVVWPLPTVNGVHA